MELSLFSISHMELSLSSAFGKLLMINGFGECAGPMIGLYRAHHVVRLAVHCTVFPLLVDDDIFELCSFSIGICM